MTNATIILNESIRLMKEGIIHGNGQKVVLETGEEFEFPEEIHTYSAWKSLGYYVRKGEKAKASFRIWKYKKGTKTDVQTNEEVDDSKMFLAKAYFFTREQVDKVTM